MADTDSPAPLPPLRRRSKRLRKKLRIGEFQEHGFAVGFRLAATLSDKERDRFWGALAQELIEPRGLAFAGGEEGYITRFGRGSGTEDDRDAVAAWLQARAGVEHVVVGPLHDCWYGSALDEA